MIATDNSAYVKGGRGWGLQVDGYASRPAAQAIDSDWRMVGVTHATGLRGEDYELGASRVTVCAGHWGVGPEKQGPLTS